MTTSTPEKPHVSENTGAAVAVLLVASLIILAGVLYFVTAPVHLYVPAQQDAHQRDGA